jgi:hypothetical protein
MRRAKHPPDLLPPWLWALLERWREWRSVIGCPKSLRLPEESAKWELKGKALIAIPGPDLIPSTAPREPGKVEEFNLAFMELGIGHQACVLALIELQQDPWLEGEAWMRFLTVLKLTPDQYERHLREALHSLKAAARKRGLA